MSHKAKGIHWTTQKTSATSDCKIYGDNLYCDFLIISAEMFHYPINMTSPVSLSQCKATLPSPKKMHIHQIIMPLLSNVTKGSFKSENGAVVGVLHEFTAF